ncbi:hypothetical protein H5400_04915 [Rhodococcus wratislaviensis]|nr:hypothetical protein [Rhodococcus sp. 3A]MBC2897014.1 hypothetical protein [Rhodococcus sp. 4CII]
MTVGESRWAASAAVLVAIGLQLALPDRLNLSFRFLLPTAEAVLLVTLIAFNPARIDRLSRPLRATSLALISVASLANAYSVIVLIYDLVSGNGSTDAVGLLTTGGAVYATNIIVFSLWYWDLDRGGPAARAHGLNEYPDFLFPQMSAPTMTHPDWEPRFADYLYVSFTNATAFSPTDTMPLSRWAKLAMLVQSGVALATIALVLARAVNVLG